MGDQESRLSQQIVQSNKEVVALVSGDIERVREQTRVDTAAQVQTIREETYLCYQAVSSDIAGLKAAFATFND